MQASSYINLISRLNSLRAYYTKTRLFYGLLFTISVISSYLLFSFILSTLSGFILPVFVRVGLLGIFLLTLSIAFSYFFLRPLFFKPTLEDLAIKIEDKFPQLKNHLIASLQLYDKLKENPLGYSTDMIEAVIEQAHKISSDLDFKKIVDKNPLKKIVKVTTGTIVIFVLTFLLFPTNFNFSLYLFSHPLTKLEPLQKFHFVISPGNAELAKFSDVSIKIKALGEAPNQIKFFWKNEGGSWNEEQLQVSGRKSQEEKIKRLGTSFSQESDSGGKEFEYSFKEIKRSFYYYAQAEDVKSDEYKITVVDKPRIIGLKLTFDYPSYTGLQNVVIDENDGNINCVMGTKVQIEAKANKELSQAQIVFYDSLVLPKEMKIDKNKATGEILVKKDDAYHIEVEDKSGYKNQDPIEYKITAVPDEYPSVEIIGPGEDRDLTERMEQDLLIRIKDDYGFSSLRLVYQIISGGTEGKEKTMNLPLTKLKTNRADVFYVWDLDQMGLIPSDIVRYRADIYDNDNFSGPKKSSSQTYSVRLPSLEEIVQEIEKKQNENIIDLEQVYKTEKDLQKKLEELSREMLKEKEIDWTKKKEMEEALKKQEELADKLKELSERLEKTTNQLEENKLLTLDMMEKMAELKKLFDEVATPEMKEAMRKLKEALEELNPEKIREALKNMKFSQEEMIKKLDRTINLLKRMKAEQKLENVLKMAEKALEQQAQINQKTDKAQKEELKNLSSDEQNLLKDVNNLEKDLKDLGDLLTELSLLSPPEIDTLSNYIDKSGLKNDMEDMSQSLLGQNKSQAQNFGGMCQKKMEDLTSNLKSAKKKMQINQLAESIDQMRKSLLDVLYLSDQEEDLYDQASKLNNYDFALRELAKKQSNLKSSTERLADDLEKLSLKTVFLSADLGRSISLSIGMMADAIKRLDERNKDAAVLSQIEALYNLNQTAKNLLESMDFASKSCAGSGMEKLFEQLKGMCQKQGGINQETFGYQNLQELSLEQKQGLERLAAEQEGVRKSVEELAKEYKERKEILGNLEDLGDQILEVVKDLKGQRVTEKTTRLQEKILSRLLDADKSLTQRDYSKKRKAEVGEDIFHYTPTTLPKDLGEKDRLARQNLEKILKEGYPQEYEKLILEYFKKISQEEKIKR